MSAPPRPDYASWLSHVCRSVGGTRRGSVLLRGAAGNALAVHADWPGDCSPSSAAAKLAAEADQARSFRMQPAAANDDGSSDAEFDLAQPFQSLSGDHGVITLVVRADAARATALGDELARAASQAPAMFAPDAPPRSTHIPVMLDWQAALDLVASVADARDASSAAKGVAQRLRVLLTADRVAVLPDRGDKPLAMAPAGPPDADATRERLLLREEAALSGRVVRAAAPGSDDALRHHHSKHAVAHRLEGVMTVALRHAGASFAYLVIERRSGEFTEAEADWLQLCASLAGPWLRLCELADRSAARRLLDRLGAFAAKDKRATHWLIASGTLAIVVLLTVAALRPIEARVTATARIEGTEQRELVAPVDGYLKAVHVRPGDTVRAGAVLAELDDRELGIEAERLQSEVAQHAAAANEALARHDRAAGVLHQAKADEAQAGLDLAAHRLRENTLRAPFDGIVVAGDLRNRTGSPVKRGDALFSVAPADRYRIVADVAERDIGGVQPGQSARLVLAAEPGRPLSMTVRRVSPVGHEVEGAVNFEIEAEPASADSMLRPGLSGIAHVDIGPRPLWKVMTGRLVDAARMAWWTWGG